MKQIIVLVRIMTEPFTIKHDNDYDETMMMTTTTAAAVCAPFSSCSSEKERKPKEKTVHSVDQPNIL